MLTPTQPLPADLTAVSLIDAKTCAAAGAISISHWQQLVRDGRAPSPVMRRQRWTRWRLADVVLFWGEASQLSDPGPSMAHAVKAARAGRA
ncbi:MAG: hypothetical protein ABMA14_05880 [Hyphomonadaceae bacterium]